MFKNIFGKKSDKEGTKKANGLKIDWIPLKSVEEIEEVKTASKEGYVGVFKHSTRCSISTTVISRFEKSFPKDINLQMYYIDLLNFREVSNAIASEFNVVHQSPQLVIIKDGESVLDASHDGILQVDLREVVK